MLSLLLLTSGCTFDQWYPQAYLPNLDTDGDGLSDDNEVSRGTDPHAADTDGDGLSDGAEIETWKTKPLVPDTDRDGVKDGDEVERGRSPVVYQDAYGFVCGDEICGVFLDPLEGPILERCSLDCREPVCGDGSCGVTERGWETAEAREGITCWEDCAVCGDGYCAVFPEGTDAEPCPQDCDPAFSTDSDGDGLNDASELLLGTDPTDADSDGGGRSDGDEQAAGTSPLDPADDFPEQGNGSGEGSGSGAGSGMGEGSGSGAAGGCVGSGSGCSF